MKLKVKKLAENAVLPKYAKPGDAAMDLTAISLEYNNGQAIYGTGLGFEIPAGHVGLIFPRSSICKKDLTLSNSVGVIDSGYRGEVKFVFNMKTPKGLQFGVSHYKIGDRIGQLLVIPYPTLEVEEVQELSDTEHGTGGFGSSGK